MRFLEILYVWIILEVRYLWNFCGRYFIFKETSFLVVRNFKLNKLSWFLEILFVWIPSKARYLIKLSWLIVYFQRIILALVVKVTISRGIFYKLSCDQVLKFWCVAIFITLYNRFRPELHNFINTNETFSIFRRGSWEGAMNLVTLKGTNPVVLLSLIWSNNF